MYSSLFRNILFPVMERYKGTTIQETLAYLQKSQWMTRQEIEELQTKKLRALIRHAYDNVPYYRKLFHDSGIYPDDIKTKTDLKKIPVLTKDDVRKNLSGLIATNAGSSDMLKRHSSGSTGEPLIYYIDNRSFSAGWAQTFRCWGWAGYTLGDRYVKISMHPRASYNKKIQDFLFNCNHLYAPGITEQSIKRDIENIQRFRPKIIRNYASHMYTMAKMMEKSDICYEGSAVTTTGSTLYPRYRKLIEKQFNCKIFDAYGGESTPVAFECEEHNGLHTCDEDLIVEYLKGGEEVSPGEIGRIVFTNLNNYTMPFIRYDIKDIGVPSDESCPCGRGLSLMKSVEGRDSDIIVTPSGNFIVVEFFALIFEYLSGVDQFQVVQESIDHLTIKIVKNQQFSDDNLDYIRTELGKKTGPDMIIDIDFVDEIPLSGRSGKRRYIISKIPSGL